jgi:8-oxo-dGTP diphosphatase
MALIDVLDKNGNLTGIVKEKDDIHRDGDWHACSLVLVINSKNEMLLQQRAFNKISNPGRWDVSVAGHVMAGETHLDAAIRETNEEIGIKISEKDLEYMYPWPVELLEHNGTYKNNQINHYYLLKIDNNKHKIKSDQNEVAALEFFSLERLLFEYNQNKKYDFLLMQRDIDEFIEYLKNEGKK